MIDEWPTIGLALNHLGGPAWRAGRGRPGRAAGARDKRPWRGVFSRINWRVPRPSFCWSLNRGCLFKDTCKAGT